MHQGTMPMYPSIIQMYPSTMPMHPCATPMAIYLIIVFRCSSGITERECLEEFIALKE